MPAPSSWRIGEEGAPTTRGYLSVLREWQRARDAWVRSVVEAVERSSPVDAAGSIVVALGSERGAPMPPDAAAILRRSQGAAVAAVRAERASMIRAGASPPALASVLGVPSGQLLTVDLVLGGVESAVLQGWAEEGAALIRRLPQDQIDSLPGRLVQAVTQGERWEAVAASLQAESAHADLIAQDQVARLNGRITQGLQSAAGVTHYYWRTSRDQRVRETHRAVADQRWSWATGAPNVGFYGESGHPGQCGRCRCTAEAEVPAHLRSGRARARGVGSPP
jgi:hypothetical protein